MPTPSPLTQVESWEQKEVQIKLERAEEFSKLTPEEQQKILQEEKQKFQEAQKKLQSDLGYQKFDPAHAKQSPQQEAEEKGSRDKELADFERKMGQFDQSKASPPESVDLKRFKALFDAAIENIEKQKPFEFQSLALNDFGQPVTHHARMIRLFDHSQQMSLKPGQIWERIEKKQSSPNQVSLSIQIDMGEAKSGGLGLTDLQMEISLASLMTGHLSERLSRFTNLVLFAAVLHDRQKKTAERKSESTELPAHKTAPESIQEILKKYFIEINEGGDLGQSTGLFQQGQAGTVVFSFNNGSVWGTFSEHGAPSNPRELQEALDKISQEK